MSVSGLRFAVFGHEVFRNWIVDVISKSFKSDVLSLSSWQVDMYGWMALDIFVLFGHQAMKPDHWLFCWMQFAMMLGFVTAYPVNWMLIRVGKKKAM